MEAILNGEYNLLDNMINRIVNKIIKETKDSKERIEIEKFLVKNRISMIVESHDNLNNLSKNKKDKIISELREEISFLKENKFLEEDLEKEVSKILKQKTNKIIWKKKKGY